jgi:hypothetical protein
VFHSAEEPVYLRQRYPRHGYADGKAKNGFIVARPSSQQPLRLLRRCPLPGSVRQNGVSIVVHGKPHKMRTSI